MYKRHKGDKIFTKKKLKTLLIRKNAFTITTLSQTTN